MPFFLVGGYAIGQWRSKMKMPNYSAPRVSPLIFALAESIFMAGATVTPPAPATSPFSCQRVLAMALRRFSPERGCIADQPQHARKADRNLLFARPHVLSAARVKENCLSLSFIAVLTFHSWLRASTGSSCRFLAVLPHRQDRRRAAAAERPGNGSVSKNLDCSPILMGGVEDQ
jgi:hypothetical protein